MQNLHQLFVLCTASHIIVGENFVAFSEYMNFKKLSRLAQIKAISEDLLSMVGILTTE